MTKTHYAITVITLIISTIVIGDVLFLILGNPLFTNIGSIIFVPAVVGVVLSLLHKDEIGHRTILQMAGLFVGIKLLLFFLRIPNPLILAAIFMVLIYTPVAYLIIKFTNSMMVKPGSADA